MSSISSSTQDDCWLTANMSSHELYQLFYTLPILFTVIPGSNHQGKNEPGVGAGSKLGQIGPKRDKAGTFLDPF